MKNRLLVILLMVCSQAMNTIMAAHDLTILCYHDVRDDVRGVLDPDQNAISLDNLVEHFDWLKAHDYHVVSIQEVIDAREKGSPLPERAVLLSFDDGLKSVYTHVFPLLKAYQYPAVVAIVGQWMNLSESEGVPYDPRPLGRDRFATWDQLREMSRSGLVEIASHSYNLHTGLIGNPQGNEFPAATTHQYDATTKSYETGESYRERIQRDLSYLLQRPRIQPNVRAIQVDLDYVHDEDPVVQERNLGLLIERVRRLGATQVWLQAFADPDGNDAADSVYFPNRHMPMRADLFSRAAWQLRTRADVVVFAWMPVMAWEMPDQSLQDKLRIAPLPGKRPETPVRLNPYLAQSRQIIGDLYEDLTRSAPIAGILFHDDAVLKDSDDLGDSTKLNAKQRTDSLIAFTHYLEQRASLWQPQLLTARNLFSITILEPRSEGRFAQSLPDFVAAYDQVALMAMPYMEGSGNPDAWMRHLCEKVKEVPQGMEATVFELQTIDWRGPIPERIPSEKLAAQMRRLQVSGARHLAYYPDDFIAGHPDADLLRKIFSISTFPHLPR